MTVGTGLTAAVAFAFGLFCLFMPVRWLGINPYTRTPNPGFNETKARDSMWIVRLAGIAAVSLGGGILALGLA